MTYRAMWPILDDGKTRNEMLGAASTLLEAMAARDGAKLVGEPVWTFTDTALLCDVPAVEAVAVPDPELDPEPITEIDADVLRYNAMGWSNRQIAGVLGVDPKTVGKCLTSYGKRSPNPPRFRRRSVDSLVDGG